MIPSIYAQLTNGRINVRLKLFLYGGNSQWAELLLGAVYQLPVTRPANIA